MSDINILGAANEKPEPQGHMWYWTYAHGELEDDLHFDIFIADQPKPSEGGHLLKYKGRIVFCNIVTDKKSRLGQAYSLAAYVDDAEAISHIINGPH